MGGFLKQALVIEKFNPGVFTASCVREDIIETNLLKMMNDLVKYTKKRQSGAIPAPKEVLTMESAEKRAKTEAAAEEAKKEEEKKTDAAWWENETQEKWAMMGETAKNWDDEESDPDEPCPDVKKNGS